MKREATFQITLEYDPKLTDPDGIAAILQDILDAHEIQCDVSIVEPPTT